MSEAKAGVVTETYRHIDSRSDNRTIKLLERIETHSKRGGIYRYEVMTNDGAPWTVGRQGKISDQTLRREYRRISK